MHQPLHSTRHALRTETTNLTLEEKPSCGLSLESVSMLLAKCIVFIFGGLIIFALVASQLDLIPNFLSSMYHPWVSTFTDSSRNVLGPVNQSFPSKHLSANLPTLTRPRRNASRALVVGHTTADDVSWLERQVLNASLALYSVNGEVKPLQVPRNKGHEVMVYLTYIIDHYYDLPEIVIFMHAHRFAWHNSELLDTDAVQMLMHLRDEHIVQAGFVNLRCEWKTGCPAWLSPRASGEPLEKQEQALIAQCWHELFPLDDKPSSIGQPCCGQFAISRARIHLIPLPRFVFYRDWLLRTPLTDYFSGRIWEFVWQYVFTGQETLCPAEHKCYCETYGMCFESSIRYTGFVEMNRQRKLDVAKLHRIGSEAEGEMGVAEDAEEDERRSGSS